MNMSTSFDRFRILTGLFFSLQLMAQNEPVITHHGYAYPAPIPIAPGQLVTLYVTGIPIRVWFRVPDGADPPLDHDGVSVRMSQLIRSIGLARFDLPILEIRTVSTCTPATCFYPIGAVTVQVPFEMEEQRPHLCRLCSVGTPGFRTIVDGRLSGAFDALSFPDQVHFLRAFDSLRPGGELVPSINCGRMDARDRVSPYNATGLPCPTIVRHADGKLVTAENPAKAGEELTAIATGLGRTDPESETGKVVRKSAPTTVPFSMDFNFRPNALATKPPPESREGVPKPVYTGSLEGAVGLYEVRFIVPPVPPGTPPCAKPAGNEIHVENVVYSNLTFSLGGYTSFDGAGICVAVEDQ